MSFVNPVTGHVKSRGVCDAFGIAPDRKHSIEMIISRLQKATPVPNGHRKYLITNGGHSYTATVNFNGEGKPIAFKFYKTNGTHRHGMANLATITMAYDGLGCQWNFNDDRRPTMGWHPKHENKLSRRLSIIAHGNAFEIGGTDTW